VQKSVYLLLWFYDSLALCGLKLSFFHDEYVLIISTVFHDHLVPNRIDYGRLLDKLQDSSLSPITEILQFCNKTLNFGVVSVVELELAAVEISLPYNEEVTGLNCYITILRVDSLPGFQQTSALELAKLSVVSLVRRVVICKPVEIGVTNLASLTEFEQHRFCHACLTCEHVEI
jgi:hypothetical protein